VGPTVAAARLRPTLQNYPSRSAGCASKCNPSSAVRDPKGTIPTRPPFGPLVGAWRPASALRWIPLPRRNGRYDIERQPPGSVSGSLSGHPNAENTLRGYQAGGSSPPVRRPRPDILPGRRSSSLYRRWRSGAGLEAAKYAGHSCCYHGRECTSALERTSWNQGASHEWSR
jgi:hypothetical protein